VARANRTLPGVARALSARLGGVLVAPCFLEAARPRIQEAVDRCLRRGATRLVFAPWFLVLGGHVAHDLPAEAKRAIARHPGLRVALARPLGYDRRLIAVMADRVRRAAGR
jgi:sirohydrochlorin ferrochelatase